MNILFISELIPNDTYASQVIFYRHLSRLASEGHNIHVICDQNSYNRRIKDLPLDFKLHVIPNRKFYYPPYRPSGILQWLRFYLLYQEYIKKIIREFTIERLIGVVNGNFLSPFTAYIQQKTKIPLFSFFHDDTIEISLGADIKPTIANTVKILRTSNTVFIASDSFKQNWPLFSHKFKLLFPIPSAQKKSVEHKIRATSISVGYSGTFYAETLPFFVKFCECLKDLNASLTIIGNNTNIDYLSKNFENVNTLPLFSTSEESNGFLFENCDLGMIIYPEEVSQMPWIKTCFPSKFIQFCSIGLPTIIVAPKDSAVGKWCIDNNWPLYLDKISATAITKLFEQVLFTEELVKQIVHVKNNIFDTEKIHAQFVNAILQ